MEVEIPVEHVTLKGDLIIPPGAAALVIFAHGSGSSMLSSRNRMVAEKLQQEGFGTLLFDLLTTREDMDRTNRFDINLITERLVEVTKWAKEKSTRHLQLGYFGASTGAAAALMAAAKLKEDIKAVVSRGGRPDLAGPALPHVEAPTLLIVGGLDDVVIDLNEQAFSVMENEKKMIIIEGATHLFEEPGKLESVAVMAVQWFNQHLKGIMVKGQ
ncbi:MAG TPA: alpha/beta fold hydrolase [Sphingobacteriaceae bacterium]